MRVMRAVSARYGATAERERQPTVAVWEGRRQSQHEPAHRGDHLHADLEQVEPQPADLRARPRSAACNEPQFLQQHVGRSGEQHAELVR